MIWHSCRLNLLFCISCVLLTFEVVGEEAFNVELGPHRDVMNAGHEGLNYFPDQPLVIIRREPLTFLMTVSDSTIVMSGPSFETAKPMRKILSPGMKGKFDNGYAGCGSAVFDSKRKEWLCFYHAEDHEGTPMVSYNKSIHGAYWSIGLASVDEKKGRVTKLGQVLSASISRREMSEEHQGLGDPCVIVDASGEYLFAYFTDQTRKDGQGCGIGMARCKLTEGGRKGSWKKFYQGNFNEPGIAGDGGFVVTQPFQNCDVIGPHVVYVPESGVYLMVCNVMAYADHLQSEAKQSGIFYCHSLDGINWSRPERLFVSHSVPYADLEYSAHPTLVVEKATKTSIEGQLFYCFTRHWGTMGEKPHHLAARSINFSVKGSSVPEPLTSKVLMPVTLPPEPAIDASDRLAGLREKAKSFRLNDQQQVIEGDLTGVPLNNDDMRVISSLIYPQRAILRDTKLTDETVRHLGALMHLEYLDLSQNPLTDESIPILASFKSLKTLLLTDTKLTTDGVNRLRAELRGCKVISRR